MLTVQHYVTFKTDVVGVQYYRGMVGKGEMVMLRREPQNQYDPNAVQVSSRDRDPISCQRLGLISGAERK